MKIVSIAIVSVFLFVLIFTQIKIFKIMRKYGFIVFDKKDLEPDDQSELAKIKKIRIITFLLVFVGLIISFFINSVLKR